MLTFKKIGTFLVALVFVCTSFISYGILNNNVLSVSAEAVSVKANYAVISNESTDIYYASQTGDFKLNSNVSTKNITSSLEPQKIDYVMPLNENLTQKTTSPTNNNIRPNMMVSSQAYIVGNTRDFFTVNFNTDNYEEIEFTLMSIGTNSNVWVNMADYGMSPEDANKITAEFYNYISPKITTAFGQPSDTDNNNKVNILCFDIKDWYPDSGWYIGGYFDPNDLFPLNLDEEDIFYNPCSNEMEVFYIDTFPAMGTTTKDVTQCYDTIAHEFQHMINFNRNFLIEKNEYTERDTWLNEAFSEAASQVYSGHISMDRIGTYNNDSNNLITSGLSAIDWYGELENYSLAYLFAEYLKEQVGIGDSVFKEVLEIPLDSFSSVEYVIKKYIDPNLTFVKFMTSFRVALLLRRDSGLYGFKNSGINDEIEPKIYTEGATTLYGGGAIVIEANPLTGNITIPNYKGSTINYFIIQDSPVITLGSYNTNPTNGDVIVTATTDVGTLDVSSHTFTENGSFEFVATNLTGDIERMSVFINNIDKSPPVVSGVMNFGSYNIATIGFSDGSATLNGISCNNGSVIRTSGIYQLITTDFLGNSSTLFFVINSTQYNYNNGELTGINPNTSTTDLRSKVNKLSTETTKVFNKNNIEIINNNTIIGTGMSLQILEGITLKSSNKIIIYGDVTGDGSIGLSDLTSIRDDLLGNTPLVDDYKTAGDLYGEGRITLNDLVGIMAHISESSSISQTARA